MDPDLWPTRARKRRAAPVDGTSALDADLFSQPQPPAPHNGAEQSERAAHEQDRNPTKRSTDRERVVAALRQAGERGLTRPEIAVVAAIPVNTVNPRVWELLAERPPRIAERGVRDGCAVLVHHSHVRPFGPGGAE